MRARTVVDEPQRCPDALDELMTLSEAAELSGRAPQTVRAAVARGKLDGRNLGGAWITTRSAVSDWMAYLAAQPWTCRGATRPRVRRASRRCARRD